MSLISLPNELLIDIASYLPTASLNSFLKTNHKLNYVLTSIFFARALDPTITESVLARAAETNSLPITQYILANTDFTTTALEICGKHSRSPVQLAVVNGFKDIVKAYIQHIPALIIEAHAADPRIRGLTPMKLAAQHGHVHIIRLFIDTYEDRKYPMATDPVMDFYHPLQVALTHRHDLVVRFLFHHLHPKYWPLIFPHVASTGWSQIVAELIPLLTDGRAKAIASALIFAAYNGHIRCVEELVDYASPIDLQRSLSAAARAGHGDVVVFLLDYIADPVDASTTALLSAVKSGNRDVVNLLLAYGARVNTPIEISGFKRRASILDWVAMYSSVKLGLDRICAALVMAGGMNCESWEFADGPHKLLDRYPPKKSDPQYRILCASQWRVRKALLGGRRHEMLNEWRNGRFSSREGVWYDHEFLGELAEGVEVAFVEAVNWF